MRHIVQSLIYSFVFLITFHANASLIVHEKYVTDNASGLDWMKLTETQNLSYNEVAGLLVSSEYFTGWRYAFIDEVIALKQNQGLISDFGCNPDQYCSFDSRNNGIAANFILTMGALETTDFSSEGAGVRYGVYGWTASRYEDEYPNGGFTGRFITQSQDFAVGSIRTHDALVVAGYSNWLDNLDESQSYLGSWLVRDNITVTEPPTFLLISLSLIGLVRLRSVSQSSFK
ncbi:MAG: hypothetical protein V7780_11465 [Colwellia sp.]